MLLEGGYHQGLDEHYSLGSTFDRALAYSCWRQANMQKRRAKDFLPIILDRNSAKMTP